jgi:ferritin-like protein
MAKTNAEAGAAAAAEPNEQDRAVESALSRLNLPPEVAGELRTQIEHLAGENGEEGQAAAGGKAGKGEGEQEQQQEQQQEAGAAAAEAEAEAAQEVETKLLASLSEEDRKALDSMAPEERAEIIKDLIAEDAAKGAGGEQQAAEKPELTPEAEQYVTTLEQGHKAALVEVNGKLEAEAAKVKELETRLQQAGTQPHQIAPIDPLFLAENATEIDKADQAIAQFEKWALKNWDGTEEVTDAKGKVTPAFSKEDIRERYAQLKEVRDRVVPEARQALKNRAAHNEEAKKIYPELFNEKREEYGVAQNILRAAPGLKAIIPNIMVVIGDALVGERIRLAKEKAKKGFKGAGNGENGKPRSRLPLARRAGGGGGMPAAGGRRARNEVSAEKFVEMGGGRSALVQMIRGMDIPMAGGRKGED